MNHAEQKLIGIYQLLQQQHKFAASACNAAYHDGGMSRVAAEAVYNAAMGEVAISLFSDLGGWLEEYEKSKRLASLPRVLSVAKVENAEDRDGYAEHIADFISSTR